VCGHFVPEIFQQQLQQRKRLDALLWASVEVDLLVLTLASLLLACASDTAKMIAMQGSKPKNAQQQPLGRDVARKI
jgi:hypothetical protein